jgi:hypothetical protein
MSQFSDQQLDEFIGLYQATFDEEISRGEAQIMLGKLVRLYGLLRSPLPPATPPSDRPFDAAPQAT